MAENNIPAIMKACLFIGKGHDKKYKLYIYRELVNGEYVLLETVTLAKYDYDTYRMIEVPDHSFSKQILERQKTLNQMSQQLTIQEIKEGILNLTIGERFTIPESDYGKAEIWRHSEDVVSLFSISYAGGDPIFERNYNISDVDLLITHVNEWI